MMDYLIFIPCGLVGLILLGLGLAAAVEEVKRRIRVHRICIPRRGSWW